MDWESVGVFVQARVATGEGYSVRNVFPLVSLDYDLHRR